MKFDNDANHATSHARQSLSWIDCPTYETFSFDWVTFWRKTPCVEYHKRQKKTKCFPRTKIKIHIILNLWFCCFIIISLKPQISNDVKNHRERERIYSISPNGSCKRLTKYHKTVEMIRANQNRFYRTYYYTYILFSIYTKEKKSQTLALFNSLYAL